MKSVKELQKSDRISCENLPIEPAKICGKYYTFDIKISNQPGLKHRVFVSSNLN